LDLNNINKKAKL